MRWATADAALTPLPGPDVAGSGSARSPRRSPWTFMSAVFRGGARSRRYSKRHGSPSQCAIPRCSSGTYEVRYVPGRANGHDDAEAGRDERARGFDQLARNGRGMQAFVDGQQGILYFRPRWPLSSGEPAWSARYETILYQLFTRQQHNSSNCHLFFCYPSTCSVAHSCPPVTDAARRWSRPCRGLPASVDHMRKVRSSSETSRGGERR